LWENRLEDDVDNDCLVSVDGTDFKIQEPQLFNPAWYSHKFNGPGVRYEVGLAIRTGHIVWINGPFPCGDYSDVTIFRLGLAHYLDVGERVEADKGYRADDPKLIKTPAGMSSAVSSVHGDSTVDMQAKVRARHETVNKRFKQFNILNDEYRHDLEMHGDVFRAVAVITELSLQLGEPLYEVEYDDLAVLEAE
jgi:DDE superfamily endonuclease